MNEGLMNEGLMNEGLMNEGLNTLLEMCSTPSSASRSPTTQMGTLQRRQIENIPYILDVLAELSYDELRLLGNVGAELQLAAGDDGGRPALLTGP